MMKKRILLFALLSVITLIGAAMFQDPSGFVGIQFKTNAGNYDESIKIEPNTNDQMEFTDSDVTALKLGELLADPIIATLTFSGIDPDVDTVSNQDYTIDANGTGDTILADDVAIGGTAPDAPLEITSSSTFTQIHVDSSANASTNLDRGATNRAGEYQVRTGNILDWAFGVVDSDQISPGTQFFIGTGGSGSAAKLTIPVAGVVVIGDGGVAGTIATTTDDLFVEDALEVGGAFDYTGDLTKAGINQPMWASAALSLSTAAMDADDGTGIKAGSITLNFAGQILRAYAYLTEPGGSLGDKVHIIINDTDDVVTPTKTLTQAHPAADGIPITIIYNEETDALVGGADTLGLISTTDKFIVAIFQDVGDDGGAISPLVGTLYVEFVKD